MTYLLVYMEANKCAISVSWLLEFLCQQALEHLRILKVQQLQTCVREVWLPVYQVALLHYTRILIEPPAEPE